MRRLIVSATALGAVALGVGMFAPLFLGPRKQGTQASGLEVFVRDLPDSSEESGNLDYGMLTELNNTKVVDSVIGTGRGMGYFFEVTYSFIRRPEFLWFAVPRPSAGEPSRTRISPPPIEGGVGVP